MIQPSLFGGVNAYGEPIAPPAQRHSETSKAAAEEIKPHAAELRNRVYAHILSCGLDGCTDEEGIEATGIAPNTYRPRRVELMGDEKRGLPLRILDSGVKRPTASGRKAVVWIANDLRAMVGH